MEGNGIYTVTKKYYGSFTTVDELIVFLTSDVSTIPSQGRQAWKQRLTRTVDARTGQVVDYRSDGVPVMNLPKLTPKATPETGTTKRQSRTQAGEEQHTAGAGKPPQQEVRPADSDTKPASRSGGPDDSGIAYQRVWFHGASSNAASDKVRTCCPASRAGCGALYPVRHVA